MSEDSGEHSLDVLRTSLRANETAQQAAFSAQGNARVALEHGVATRERVAALELQAKSMDGKLDRVLFELGKLSERGPFDRLMMRCALASITLACGGVGVWVVLQLLDRAKDAS